MYATSEVEEFTINQLLFRVFSPPIHFKMQIACLMKLHLYLEGTIVLVFIQMFLVYC